jgi:hypothetical protein
MKKVLFFCLMSFLSCDKQSQKTFQIGNWGAEGASLNMQESSWYLELGCAHLTVKGSIILIDGQFQKTAEYFQESGAYFEDPDFYEARLGRVSGRLMENGDLEINIQAGENLDDSGTFTFRLNRESKVHKCA